jgi:hypothetical protein
MLQHFKKSKKILLNQINFNRYVESIRWSEIFKTFLKTIRICFIINITSFLALTTLLRVFLYKILKTLFKNWTQPKVALIDVFLLLCITITFYSLHYNTYIQNKWIAYCGGCLFTIIIFTAKNIITTIFRKIYYKIKNK